MLYIKVATQEEYDDLVRYLIDSRGYIWVTGSSMINYYNFTYYTDSTVIIINQETKQISYDNYANVISNEVIDKADVLNYPYLDLGDLGGLV